MADHPDRPNEGDNSRFSEDFYDDSSDLNTEPSEEAKLASADPQSPELEGVESLVAKSTPAELACRGKTTRDDVGRYLTVNLDAINEEYVRELKCRGFKDNASFNRGWMVPGAWTWNPVCDKITESRRSNKLADRDYVSTEFGGFSLKCRLHLIMRDQGNEVDALVCTRRNGRGFTEINDPQLAESLIRVLNPDDDCSTLKGGIGTYEPLVLESGDVDKEVLLKFELRRIKKGDFNKAANLKLTSESAECVAAIFSDFFSDQSAFLAAHSDDTPRGSNVNRSFGPGQGQFFYNQNRRRQGYYTAQHLEKFYPGTVIPDANVRRPAFTDGDRGRRQIRPSPSDRTRTRSPPRRMESHHDDRRYRERGNQTPLHDRYRRSTGRDDRQPQYRETRRASPPQRPSNDTRRQVEQTPDSHASDKNIDIYSNASEVLIAHTTTESEGGQNQTPTTGSNGRQKNTRGKRNRGQGKSHLEDRNANKVPLGTRSSEHGVTQTSMADPRDTAHNDQEEATSLILGARQAHRLVPNNRAGITTLFGAAEID